MRIGVITYALDRPQTGIARYTTELIRALVRLNSDHELILLTAGGMGPLSDLNIDHYRLLGAQRVPGLLALGNVLLPLAARRLKLDILHDCSGITPFLFGGGQARTVVTLYDVIPWSFPGVSTQLDTLIYRQWLPRLLPRVSAIVTISEASKQDITRFMHIQPQKIHNLRAGVRELYTPVPAADIDQVREKYKLPPCYLLYVGSVEERKNLRRVLQAYAQIKNTIAQQLVIVGPKQWKYATILDTLTALSLDDHVVFTGYVDEGDLPALYSGADVFLFPSLYEGFGLPVLEAMACGTAVITSSVSSLPEVIGDAGIQINPYNTDALAAAIRQLVSDDALRARYASAGLERSRQFTWEASARALLAVYQAALNQPREKA